MLDLQRLVVEQYIQSIFLCHSLIDVKDIILPAQQELLLFTYYVWISV